MGRKWHLLLRDEAGATLVSGFSQLPTVYRFFAGGDNSVRGFSYNALSPLDPAYTTDARTHLSELTYIKVGGKDVITGTVEVIRDLPRNFGVAAFFDYGNAFNRFGTPFIAHGSNCRTPLTLEPAPAPPPASPPNGLCLEYSVGVGFRVRLPVMTLGVDIAKPLSRSAGPRLHINFSPKL
jgi:translocation and assembly module TamA